MKAIFKTTNKSGAYTYSLQGTDKEIAAYKAAKGSFYREDENEAPLYFTSRPLNSETEYSLDAKGYLVAEDSAQTQTVLNALSTVAKLSLNDLQKFAAMKAAGLI